MYYYHKGISPITVLLFSSILLLSFLLTPILVNATSESQDEKEREFEEEREQDFDECPGGRVAENGVDCVPEGNGDDDNDNAGSNNGNNENSNDNGNTNDNDSPSDTNFLTYNNFAQGITIQYPFRWLKTEQVLDASNDREAFSVMFDKPGVGYTGNVQIVVDPLDSSLVEYLPNSIEVYKKEYGDRFKVTSSSANAGTLAGYPAYKLEYTRETGYTNSDEIVTVKNLEIGTKINDTFYRIIYSAEEGEIFDKSLMLAQKIMDTFQLTEKGAQSSSVSSSQQESQSTSNDILPQVSTEGESQPKTTSLDSNTNEQPEQSVPSLNELGTSAISESSNNNVSSELVSDSLSVDDNATSALEDIDSISDNQSQQTVPSLQEPTSDLVSEPTNDNVSSNLMPDTSFSEDNTTSSLEPVSDLQTYENLTLGFSIQHPDEASITTRNDIVAFTLPKQASSNNSAAYILVRVSNLTTPEMPLENYSSVTLNALSESRTGFNAEEQETNATLSGNPAHSIIYMDTQGENERKTLQTWTVTNDKAFDITYVTDATNFDANLPVVQQMIDSFQIIGEGVSTPSLDSPSINDTGFGQLQPDNLTSLQGATDNSLTPNGLDDTQEERLASPQSEEQQVAQANDTNIDKAAESGSGTRVDTGTNLLNNFASYTNSSIGVKLVYPSNFEKLNFGNSVVFHTPLQSDEDVFSELVSILTLDDIPSTKESTKEFLEGQLDSFKNSFPDYILSDGPTSINLNGNSALQAKFDSMVDNTNNKIIKIWTISQDRNRAYQIEISVPADKYPSFPPEHIQTMIDSIQIIGQDANSLPSSNLEEDQEEHQPTTSESEEQELAQDSDTNVEQQVDSG